ncbi:MAG TPA: FAD-binding oxidoreductase [Candidatus Acidoferrales bacterium]|nr:FAD-binding oxidoreductase [Candidatus Acidoferrales bacterium]
MEPALVKTLESIVGKDEVITTRDRMMSYLSDESPPLLEPKPANDVIVVRPSDVNQVSAVLKFANEHSIPVVARGGGTGLVGGAVPTRNGIVLSFERMNQISVDKDNLMAVAGAGATLGALIEAAGRAELAFPPHPGDENAQIGGLVATNAGGARAVRHGVMRNQVRGVEVVLPTGEILNLGGKVHKNNTGYDLMQLMIGSEGTLGVVTQATIQLYAKSGASLTLIVPYSDRRAAIATVPKILQQAGAPLAIEYVEKDLVERSAKQLGTRWPVTTGDYYLMIIVAEGTRDEVLASSLKISEICKQNTNFEVFAAESQRDQDNILKIRSNLYEVLRGGIYDILDIVVPITDLEKIVAFIEQLSKKYDVALPVYGHAGDGNLHVHLMQKPGGIMNYEALTDEIYHAATAIGGVITGEHGIGKTRTSKIAKYLSKTEIEIMKKVKEVFDPNNILNPGAKVPA